MPCVPLPTGQCSFVATFEAFAPERVIRVGCNTISPPEEGPGHGGYELSILVGNRPYTDDFAASISSARLSTESLKELARGSGASLVGIADLSELNGIRTHPANLLSDYGRAISVGVRLEDWSPQDGSAEGRAFSQLDEISDCVSDYIQAQAYRTLVVHPDKRAGKRRPLNGFGAVSHKAVARAAGLGWIGRSTLLVTREFGPRVCLATLLTDMPLVPDHAQENLCGECSMCIEACPAGALKWTRLTDPLAVSAALDTQRCGSWLTRVWRRGGVCYECMSACPWGRAAADNNGDVRYDGGCDLQGAEDDGQESLVTRLHNAWLARQQGCRGLRHGDRRTRIILYGSHVQTVNLCKQCFKTGKGEHRQLARRLTRVANHVPSFLDH